MYRFGALGEDGRLPAKYSVSAAEEHELVYLSGAEVDRVWQDVSGRTRAVSAWCDLLQTRLDQPPVWTGQRRPSELYLDRSPEATSSMPGEDAAEDEADGASRLVPQITASVNWRSQPKLRVIGSGGEGKTWWAAHELTTTIEHVRAHLSDGGDPDAVELPVWIDRESYERTEFPRQDGWPHHRQETALVEPLVHALTAELATEDATILVPLLIRQILTGKARIVFDAAEHYPLFATHVLEHWQVAEGGRIWVTTRPEPELLAIRSPALAEVRLRPFGPRQTQQLLARLTGTEPDPNLLDRILNTPTTGPIPLLISLAAEISGQLPQRPGAAPLLIEALKELWARASVEAAEEADMEGPVEQILCWVGSWLVDRIHAESERISAESRHARDQESDWLPPPRPVLTQGRFAVHKSELLPLLRVRHCRDAARVCGLVAVGQVDSEGNAPVDLSATNDVIRDLAIAYAIARDDEKFSLDAIDEWGHWVRRLAIVADSRMPTIAGFIGELLNPLDQPQPTAGQQKSEQERVDRLEALLVLLARPTPLTELPDDDLRRIAPGWRPPR